MMRLKERLLKTKVVSAKYKGKGFETVPVVDANYFMMSSQTFVRSKEVER